MDGNKSIIILIYQDDRLSKSLAAADLLREQIQKWQEAHGIQPDDSVEILRELREARDDQLGDFR